MKEDVKHVLEKLCGCEPEDVFCKVIMRETNIGGLDDIIHLSKKILQLSHKDDDTNTPIHLAQLDASRIRNLLFYKKIFK